MATGYSPKIVTDGLVLALDAANIKSFRGEPTTNFISNADTMTGWTNYYRTVSSSTFTTEFGTTGYRFVNQPSWNGIYRIFNLVNSGTYTFSAWYRYWGGSASNNGATVYVSNYGSGDTATALNKNIVGEWQRISRTVSVTAPTNVYFYMISYGGVDNGTGDPDYSSWDVTMPQIEAKSYATPFVNGTRGTTVATGGGWADRSGNSNHGELVNGPTYSSSNLGSLVFDGVNDYISNIPNTGITHGTSNFSYFSWVNLNGKPSLGTIFENGSWTSCLLIRYETNGITIYSMGSYWGKFSFDPTLGTWNYLGFIRNGNTIQFYLNGIFQASLNFTANISPSSNIFIGTSQHATSQVFNGKISMCKIYTKALSTSEILQNYNATKGRYGL